MPNSGRSRQSEPGSTAKNIATFGFGALVGALAAGAAWYLSSEEDPQPQRSRYTTNHPAYQSSPPVPQNNTENDADEKYETVKVCEICFVSFNELKECGVQIVATPCGHIYCKDCIVGALSVKPECPHCRSGVREDQLRRLYM